MQARLKFLFLFALLSFLIHSPTNVVGFCPAPGKGGLCRYLSGFSCELCRPGNSCQSNTNNGLSATEKPCKRGYYQENEGACSCFLCQANRYSSAETGATMCTECPAGTDTRGKTGQVWSTSCIPCDTGMVSGRGENCIPCSIGTFRQTSSHCASAPIGSFVSTQRATAPTSCPNGKTTHRVRSTSSNDCKKAPAGYYATSTTTAYERVALPCPRGHSSITGRYAASTSSAEVLRACNIICKGEGVVNGQYYNGEFSSAQSKHLCQRCERGFYAPNPGSYQCLPYNRNDPGRKHFTPSYTITQTISATVFTLTRSLSLSKTVTTTATTSRTFTLTRTISLTPLPTPTETQLATETPSASDTLYPTETETHLDTETLSASTTSELTPSPTHVATPTPSASSSTSESRSVSEDTPSESPSFSDSETETVSISPSFSSSESRSATDYTVDSFTPIKSKSHSESETETLHFVPVPRQPDAIPSAAVAANMIVSAVAGSSQNAVAVSKIVAIQRMQSCGSQDGKDQPLPPTPLGPDMNFMMLEIPAPDDEDNIFATQRGAIVGNTLITFIFLLVSFLVALLRSHTSKISLYKAFIKTRFPGFTAVLVQVTTPGIAGSLGILMAWKRTSGVDIVLMIIAFLVIIAMFVWFIWILWYGKKIELVCYTLDNPKDMEDRTDYEQRRAVVDLQELIDLGAEDDDADLQAAMKRLNEIADQEPSRKRKATAGSKKKIDIYDEGGGEESNSNTNDENNKNKKKKKKNKKKKKKQKKIQEEEEKEEEEEEEGEKEKQEEETEQQQEEQKEGASAEEETEKKKVQTETRTKKENIQQEKEEEEEKQKQQLQQQEEEVEEQEKEEQKQREDSEWFALVDKVVSVAPVKLTVDTIQFVTRMGMKLSEWAVVRFWFYFASATEEWPRCTFVRIFGPAFESYSNLWFLVIEATSYIMINAVSGASTVCVSKSCCFSLASIALLFALLHIGSIVRKSLFIYTSRMERLANPLLSGIITLLTFMIVANTADPGYIGLPLIQGVSAAAFYLSWVCLIIQLSWNFLPAFFSFKRYLQKNIINNNNNNEKSKNKRNFKNGDDDDGAVDREVNLSTVLLIDQEENEFLQEDEEMQVNPNYYYSPRDNHEDGEGEEVFEHEDEEEEEEEEGEEIDLDELEERERQARIREYDKLDSKTVQSLYDQFSAQLRSLEETEYQEHDDHDHHGEESSAGTTTTSQVRLKQTLRLKVESLHDVLADRSLFLSHHNNKKASATSAASASAAAAAGGERKPSSRKNNEILSALI